ncbi:uncharacterized protein V6R79_003201 [Siganus canaliculatus]
MISFWLLCWKLLRATAGLRRTTPELTDGSHSNPDSNAPHPDEPADPVTMEISSSPPLTDLERDTLTDWRSQEVEELNYPETEGTQQPIKDEQAGDEVRVENAETDECDYLVFEIGEHRRGEEVGESDGGAKAEEEEGGGEGRGQTDEEEKDEGRGNVAGDGSKGGADSEDGDRREDEGDAGIKIEGEDEESGGGGGGGGGGGVTEEDGWRGDTSRDVTELLFESESPNMSSTDQPSAAMLQDTWGHDPSTRDDLSDSHLSDCLQAELAVVYSDSDAGDDQWAAFGLSDVTNQEGAGGEIHDVISDAKSQEESRGGEDEEGAEGEEEGASQQKEEEEEEKGGGGEDEEEQMKMRRDLFLRSPSASSTASSTDPDRKVPSDFSVHQDTHSANVSSEHVDFLLARQQWKKMEAEVKGQPIPQPGLRAQGNFQGTHTSLYPPTRSPRLKHREMNQAVPKEAPLSSTLSPSSEDSGLDDSSYRSPLEEPETAVEREIRLTLEREERHRKERGMIAQGLPMPRPTTLQTGRSPPRPPACRTPTLSISPSPSCSSSLPRSIYHEMTANNVIILEPDSSASRSRLLAPAAIGAHSDWPSSLDTVPSANVIVVETSNLIIRSASEFCLSSAPVSVEPQESTFTSNPFFKLRSLSSQSLVEQEIRLVRQREEEWRRQREEMWRRRREEEWRKGREKYDTVLVSPGLNDSITYNVPEVPDRCVSSPSSPSRTRKMERSSLSCDHKFPPSLSSVPRRQNTMAQRWEASLLANQKKE